MKTPRLLLISAFLLSTFYACDKATPVAPTGAVLTLSASPTDIAANGSSTITVRARRENGSPVNTGTQILLSATLGELSATTVETDETGIAIVTLRGTGRPGESKVIARSGPSESNEVTVQIGRFAGSVSLQASPTFVPESGDRIELTALLRDGQGQPLPNVLVNFRADIGDLASGGLFVTTNLQGIARDTLTIDAADLAPISGDSFKVSVQATGTGGAAQTAEATITIGRPPLADFEFTVNNSARTVAFRDLSTRNPNRWRWDFGDGESSTQQNPVHQYPPTGTTFAVTLTVGNALGESSVTNFVTFNTTGGS